MSTAAEQHDPPHGLALLPRDLTAAELAAAPVLRSLDDLAIEDLSDEEFEKFDRAISE